MPRKGAQPGARNHQWKGGRTIASSGYVLVKQPDHHRADSRGYVYEHILVAEQVIGRPILRGEQVHHKNHVKTDNRPENLSVKSSRAHHALEHRKRTDLRNPDEPNVAIDCACGCGQTLLKYDQENRPAATPAATTSGVFDVADKTDIEWTDRTWNAVTGCTQISAGCDNCYARTIAERFRGGAAFPTASTSRSDPTRSTPLTWRKPAKVFVNSMSDLFHAGIDRAWIADIFAVMAAAPVTPSRSSPSGTPACAASSPTRPSSTRSAPAPSARASHRGLDLAPAQRVARRLRREPAVGRHPHPRPPRHPRHHPLDQRRTPPRPHRHHRLHLEALPLL